MRPRMMKTITAFCLSTLLVTQFPVCANKATPGPYDGSWEALQKMPVPAVVR
jgi:hypothetical protein